MKRAGNKLFYRVLYLLCLTAGINANTTMVSLKHFIELSCQKDTTFQQILIDELRLHYNEILTLPSADLLLTLNGEYGVTFSGLQQPKVQLSLSKLFPLQGSSFQTQFSSTSVRTNQRRDEIDFMYNIDLLRNAFGRSRRMLSHFIGMENQIVRYQIVQTYEAYLSSLIQYYYTWMKTHGELLAAQASVLETNKLLNNIQKRKSRYIALQVEIDKAKLQVLDKEERLRKAKEEFVQTTIRVAYSMGMAFDSKLIPDTTGSYSIVTNDVEEYLITMHFDSTRTGKMYTELFQRDSIAIAMAIDDLLPSLSVYAGLGIANENGNFTDNSRIIAGVNLSFPFRKSQQKARVEIARLEQKQSFLNARIVINTIKMRFAQLQASIESHKEALSLTEKRLILAQAVLNAERKDYRYGRTSLNDLLQALNTLQTNRLLSVHARIDLARIRLEAMELFDQLVTETNIDTLRNDFTIP